ncbi:hypothetical protein ACVIWV_001422 [Bradyrhizobium diazoefficiens]|uniref:hypothetical protein n=1 Tax=Bradyrhizobium TaxID=374 RepID=UPI001495460C|nr:MULTISPECIES: hypothetical protein [Bradyrhizobium]
MTVLALKPQPVGAYVDFKLRSAAPIASVRGTAAKPRGIQPIQSQRLAALPASSIAKSKAAIPIWSAGCDLQRRSIHPTIAAKSPPPTISLSPLTFNPLIKPTTQDSKTPLTTTLLALFVQAVQD